MSELEEGMARLGQALDALERVVDQLDARQAAALAEAREAAAQLGNGADGEADDEVEAELARLRAERERLLGELETAIAARETSDKQRKAAADDIDSGVGKLKSLFDL